MNLTASDIARMVPDLRPESTLYVADEDLQVIYSNEEWRRFAKENKGEELANPPLNTRLLDSMSRSAGERWAAIYGLLLEKRLSHYEEDFICSSPEERRIFRLRITPTETPDGHGTWLVHHTIRIDDSAEDREQLRQRLRALESDPELLESEYRRRVMKPKIEVPGFSVAEYFRPLEDIGGDLTWHRQYPDGETDLVVADAMGHGYEASLHAAKLAIMLDALAASDREPQDLLASLNRGLIRNRPSQETAFATGLHFRFRQGTSRLRCANFGHSGPMFSRTGHVDLKVGVALGLVDTLPIWPETELDLDEHGARFLVFSDGITEQFNPAGEMYGTDRLLQAFRAALELDVDTMLQRIVEDVTTFRDDAPVKDDLTLIALELAE